MKWACILLECRLSRDCTLHELTSGVRAYLPQRRCLPVAMSENMREFAGARNRFVQYCAILRNKMIAIMRNIMRNRHVSQLRNISHSMLRNKSAEFRNNPQQ